MEETPDSDTDFRDQVDKVDAAVAELCQDVVNEPLCFFSEADLQAMMYVRLGNVFRGLVPLGQARGPRAKERFKTSRVHREYGAGERRRLDLVVLSTAGLSTANRFYKNGDDYLRPELGFEFGTERIGDDALHHVRRDAEKLQGCRRGYLVHVFRDMAAADTGTELREKTEKRIERVFCGRALEIKFPANVRAVLIVVRIARSEKRIRGRCRLFTAKKWRTVNAKDVAREVRKLLSAEGGG